MSKYTDALIDFHNAIYEKTGFEATKINQEFYTNGVTARAREYLHREEIGELEDILLGNDEDLSKAHMLKEICDVLYVVYGTVVTFGLQEVLDEAFDRVHSNNILKITTGTVNTETGKFTKPKDHPKVYLKDLTGEEISSVPAIND
jgi:hypothetical protein